MGRWNWPWAPLNVKWYANPWASRTSNLKIRFFVGVFLVLYFNLFYNMLPLHSYLVIYVSVICPLKSILTLHYAFVLDKTRRKEKTNKPAKKSTVSLLPLVNTLLWRNSLIILHNAKPGILIKMYMFCFQDENGKYCAEKDNILLKISPQPGMAILFNHHRLHEGQQVR